MKKLRIGLAFAIICFSLFSMAQVAAPVVPAAPIVNAIAPVIPVVQASFFSELVLFVKSNLAVVAGLVYFLIDLIILVTPSLAGNGLLHQIMITAGKLSGQTPPPTASA